MTTPIIEQIIANLIAALQTITVANGYNYSLAFVQRKQTPQNIPAELGAIIQDEDPESDPDETEYEYLWNQVFTINILGVRADGGDASIDERLNRLWADVSKAILPDQSRGGYAHWTKPRKTTKYEDGIEIPFIVRYPVKKYDFTANI